MDRRKTAGVSSSTLRDIASNISIGLVVKNLTTSLLAGICALSSFAHCCSSSPGPGSARFDPRGSSIQSVHDALFTHGVSCTDIVSSFLARIEAYNPILHAVIHLNPLALERADELDALLRLAKTNPNHHHETIIQKPSPLFCIPVLLKDNFDAASLPTTGGSLALHNLIPTHDAPSVAALRAAGAIILGKTNLHEFALEGLSVSSIAGQTRNPYAPLSRTPGGSSGGSGAALGASLAVLATGTDTVNSLRSPASANGLVSVRPTQGLVRRAGVMPCSWTQDVVGPMAREVRDVAVMLDVMKSAGGERGRRPGWVDEVSYVDELERRREEKKGLKGVRLGIVKGFFNRSPGPETDPVNQIMDSMLDKLRHASGVELVDIEDSVYNSSALLGLDVQRFEFRECMNSYLQNPELKGDFPRSLEEIYATGKDDFLVIPHQYAFIHDALRSSTANETYARHLQDIANLTRTLHQTFKSHTLDALIYPQQSNLVVPIGSRNQAGRNGILAALTGSPVVAIPAGFSAPTNAGQAGIMEGSTTSEEAPVGIPIGMEILGLPWSEAELLGIASGVEEMMGRRVKRMPQFSAGDVVVKKRYERVPEIVFDEVGEGEYPLGTLG
ncbi:hypothetical protein AJ80_00630 [Polytolypa hystricis UAMH7299]|uniref:Amidase domain-containing protein n=1 Tax=Polytolypa hystricis (strain UAMH7299) TaxID=1447883 RepID=A0A2B7Z462_POLH7|nr:hypothetical protein AJ80_00630 [Polytolypa hystricis UAMH7299]